MFDRFFNSDNVIWLAMGKIFDLFILNLLLLFCSIPIVTIGPALTGFYYALINMVRDEEVSVVKEFFGSFRRNFRQGIFLGVPFTVVLLFLMIDIWLCRQSGTGIYSFFMFFFFIIMMMVIFVAVYAFPILAKFEKSNKEILILAFTLSISHFGKTLMMFFLAVLGAWITHLLPGLLFLIFGLEGFYQASLMVKIFEPWLPDRAAVTDECPPILTDDESEDPQ